MSTITRFAMVTIITVFLSLTLAGCIQPPTMKVDGMNLLRSRPVEDGPTTPTAVPPTPVGHGGGGGGGNPQPVPEPTDPTATTTPVPVDPAEEIRGKTNKVFVAVANLSNQMYGASWPRRSSYSVKLRKAEDELIGQAIELANLVWNNDQVPVNDRYLAANAVGALRETRRLLGELQTNLDRYHDEENSWPDEGGPGLGKAVSKEMPAKPSLAKAVGELAGTQEEIVVEEMGFADTMSRLTRQFDEAEETVKNVANEERSKKDLEAYLKAAKAMSRAEVYAHVVDELSTLPEFDELDQEIQSKAKSIASRVEILRTAHRNYDDPTSANLREAFRSLTEMFRARYLDNPPQRPPVEVSSK